MDGSDMDNAEHNHEGWLAFFRDRRLQAIVVYEGPPPPPARNNIAGRRLFWAVNGRTIAAVITHIEAGNNPPLV